MDKVIIDNSAWLESFRSNGDARLIRVVKDLIVKGHVLLPGIIRTELLRGAKNRKEFNKLDDLLKGLTYSSVEEEFWNELSDFSFGLFRKGVVVPLIDTYIALICMKEKALILHCDKHFELIARKFPLKVLPY